jgi:CubicO group peptidase (beta-lactamase class C family)
MRRALFFVLLVALCAPSVRTQQLPQVSQVPQGPQAPQGPLEGLDSYIAHAVKDWRVPGLAAAVVKDGQVVFAKGYGVRELGKTAPVDTHTLFAIGSTTKAMTAALIAMLVDEKKVEWDAPVTQYLPWFQLKDPAATRELMVRDLLTHRAGLGNADYLWYGQANSTTEILRRVRLIDPSYPIRSGFIYQNIMYAAAGAVIESASGKPWAEMMRTRIFEPLGMTGTVPTATMLGATTNVATPHDVDVLNGQVRTIENVSVDPVAAAGAVWSSVGDMSKWMQFLLDGGRVGGTNGKRLLSEASFAELFTPQTIAPFEMYPTTRIVKPHWMTYGLGWFQQDYRGQAVDFHTGSIDGMVAIHGLIRDQRLGVYVLANLDHAEVRHAIMYSVFDRYAGRSDRDWNAEFLKLYGDLRQEADATRAKKDALRVAGTSPSVALQTFAGDYTEPLHGDVKVTYDSGGLRIRYGTAFVGALEHWHYNTFRATWKAAWREPALVNFVLDEDGQPSTLEMMNARFTRR